MNTGLLVNQTNTATERTESPPVNSAHLERERLTYTPPPVNMNSPLEFSKQNSLLSPSEKSDLSHPSLMSRAAAAV
jgi:hypothetical protein